MEQMNSEKNAEAKTPVETDIVATIQHKTKGEPFIIFQRKVPFGIQLPIEKIGFFSSYCCIFQEGE